MDEIVSIYQRRRKQSIRIEDVQSTYKKQWFATHTHIKGLGLGLGLDVTGNAIPLSAGFMGPGGRKRWPEGHCSLPGHPPLGSHPQHHSGTRQQASFHCHVLEGVLPSSLLKDSGGLPEGGEDAPRIMWHKLLWAVHNLDKKWLLLQKRMNYVLGAQ